MTTPSRTPPPVWLVFSDALSSRIVFDSGIVQQLHDRLGDRAQPVFLMPRNAVETWLPKLPPTRRPLQYHELFPAEVQFDEKVVRRLDALLDRKIGYYPLAIRFNYRHGFHLERMTPGHGNVFLDSDKVGPLPRWGMVDEAMLRWHYSRRRYVSRTLARRLAGERPAIVLFNLQMQTVVPFLLLGDRLDLRVVGSVASWDHTVGKGVIAKRLDRYLVQNEQMREDLISYHEIDDARIVVTGWPQSDVFHDRRPREDFDRIVAGYGLDPTGPVVLAMGNTPKNTPGEGRFFARLAHWRASHDDAPSILFRPHPRDREWRTRFATALGAPGCAVQEPSHTDLDVLATLLQHGDCVVTNAGTIMLDALVNDRPVVCVLYDEGGGPPSESWAAKSVIGEHYRDVAESGAYLPAESFEEVLDGIRRCLASPGELAAERRKVVERVVGTVDGKAATRYVDAILDGLAE